MLDVDGKLQWETPVVINRNLVARYSRRYFDKAPQVASNKRVERQSRVRLGELYVSPCGPKKGSDFFDASRCNRAMDERETDCIKFETR